MEQNFSSSIPSLTLEPELEPVQEQEPELVLVQLLQERKQSQVQFLS